jgi:hypothetical protein
MSQQLLECVRVLGVLVAVSAQFSIPTAQLGRQVSIGTCWLLLAGVVALLSSLEGMCW